MKKPENQILVIFGASGHLTSSKLIPALFELEKQNLLPERFAILGIGRTALSDDDFRDKMKVILKNDKKEVVGSFIKKLFFCSINTDDENAYSHLKKKLLDINMQIKGNENYVYYLSTPPVMYIKISKHLHLHNLCGNCPENKGFKRIVIEKPFGTNLQSAVNLNKELLNYFTEEQIYRIDHYLGKETAQNILITRFNNSIFEPLWNRNYVSHVEITSAENTGIEKRSGYYESAGALRDMLQNHLLMLTALTSIEAPSTFNSLNLRDEILKLFKSLRPFSEQDIKTNVIRGQYTSSVINGKKNRAYCEEEGVSPNSRTETYVAMKFFIDNHRWAGVPFYIRTGKALPTKVTEIVLHFRPTPHQIFKDSIKSDSDSMLIIRIQPDEGLQLKIGVKVPGSGFNVQTANMNFRYKDMIQEKLPDSYERLLLDCMNGDLSLFSRADTVEQAWTFVNPILDLWENNSKIKLYGYPAGTWGPAVADKLISESGSWRYPCKNLINDGLYCEL